MGERLGVGVGRKPMARALELGAQHIGVLDDAVVHERQRARAVGVWVCVTLGGRAVSRPARVPDAAGPVERILPEAFPEGRDATSELPSLHPATVQHGHAGRVVASVLQPRQAIQQHGDGILRSDVSHDAAHRSGPLLTLALVCPTLEQRRSGNREAEASELC
jgi:hypothetical protein